MNFDQDILTWYVDELSSLSEHVGWFISDGMPPSTPFDTTDHTWPFHCKRWFHKQGEYRDTIWIQKTRKTITILINGSMKILFPDREDQDIVLSKVWTFVYFAPNVGHTRRAMTDCTMMTVRR